MPHALGIDLGSGHLTAAVCRNDRERWTDPEILALEGAAATDFVLHLTDEGGVEVGERVLRHVANRPDRIARRVIDRVGDEIPITLGGRPYPAEALIAAVVGWVVDYAEATEGTPPIRLVVTHPAGWGGHRRATLLGALRETDLPELALLPRPVAAAESYAATERVEIGQDIAVHSLGASRFESAVLRRAAYGFEMRAHADSVETMGGDLFDDLLAEHVLAELGGDVEPMALAKLRVACRTAKERLSTELAVTVPAPARSMRGTVMVNRTDLEELIRPAVEATVATLRRTIQSAKTSTGSLQAVVLVGGSGRIPLVSELVSAAVRVRVTAASEPELSVARGAALAAARVTKPPAPSRALTHRPEPMSPPAVNSTDLMRFDDLPDDQLADIGPPPPRPPVEITPLEPPKRRLLPTLPALPVLGGRSGTTDPDDHLTDLRDDDRAPAPRPRRRPDTEPPRPRSEDEERPRRRRDDDRYDGDRNEWPGPADQDAFDRGRRRGDDRVFNESLSRARRPSRDEDAFDSAVDGEYEVADEPRSGRRHR
ncbi:MAG: Hsp70 family protein [Actinophytocola sp.]|uniref:Hsp70 family protein n=1 Tax=Actinophytocola sp. TaxID=1872138 RepID=UPI003D6A603A